MKHKVNQNAIDTLQKLLDSLDEEFNKKGYLTEIEVHLREQTKLVIDYIKYLDKRGDTYD